MAFEQKPKRNEDITHLRLRLRGESILSKGNSQNKNPKMEKDA